MKFKVTQIDRKGRLVPIEVSTNNIWKVMDHDGKVNPHLRGKVILKMSDGRNVVIEETREQIAEYMDFQTDQQSLLSALAGGSKATPMSLASAAAIAALVTGSVGAPKRIEGKANLPTE